MNILKKNIIKLITINKLLLKMINDTLSFKPGIKKAALDLLKEYDKTKHEKASFWKDKIKKI